MSKKNHKNVLFLTYYIFFCIVMIKNSMKPNVYILAMIFLLVLAILKESTLEKNVIQVLYNTYWK